MCGACGGGQTRGELLFPYSTLLPVSVVILMVLSPLVHLVSGTLSRTPAPACRPPHKEQTLHERRATSTAGGQDVGAGVGSGAGIGLRLAPTVVRKTISGPTSKPR
jgi:hypothetical protein